MLSNYEEDKDRLAEVVYEWCSRVQNIRWGDVAAMCRNIGHSDLANALDKVYQTGQLHSVNEVFIYIISSKINSFITPRYVIVIIIVSKVIFLVCSVARILYNTVEPRYSGPLIYGHLD